MKLNINIEFSGEMTDIVKDFNALGSILSSVNYTTSATALPSDVSKTGTDVLRPNRDPMEQHPKADAVEKADQAPKNVPAVSENATITPTPTPSPVKAAAPEPVKPAVPGTPAVPVPTAPAKKYTLDELLAATAPLMDAGKIADLQALMQKFGVPSMMDIPEAKYGELATALRELGAEL